MKTNLLKMLLPTLAMLLIMTSCSSDNDGGIEPPLSESEQNGNTNESNIKFISLSEDEKDMAAAANDFALNLFGAYDSLCGTKDNVALSPLSIQMALSMLANGACGSTYESIVDVLGWNGRSIEDINAFSSHLMRDLPRIAGKGSMLAIANGMWHSPSFPVNEEYKSALQATFGSSAEMVDAGKVVGVVNKWCSDNTNGLIDNIMSMEPSRYTMVLANALYFKSGWACDFDSKYSQDGMFTNSDAKTSKVVYMKTYYNDTKFVDEEKFSMASLPLEDRDFMFSIILPKEDVSMDEAISALKEYGFNKALNMNTGIKMYLTMPRFEVSTNISVAPRIMDMGGQGIFDGGADYGLISPMELTVDDIIHATRLMVDEDGVEGGAATVLTVDGDNWDSNVSKPLEFKADRTFLFCITEHSTKAVLFIGRVGY